MFDCHFPHVFKAVLRVSNNIIGTDCCHTDTHSLQIMRVADNTVQNRQDIGAMITNEHHQCPIGATYVAQIIGFSISGRQ